MLIHVDCASHLLGSQDESELGELLCCQLIKLVDHLCNLTHRLVRENPRLLHEANHLEGGLDVHTVLIKGIIAACLHLAPELDTVGVTVGLRHIIKAESKKRHCFLLTCAYIVALGDVEDGLLNERIVHAILVKG